jgi:hypothetical protein
MAEASQVLASLRHLVHAQREEMKEKLAVGNTNYAELVGRCKAYEWVIDKISAQIKSLNQGADDGRDD